MAEGTDRKKKIIIIDDDREFLSELADTLKGAGYDVIALSECRSLLDVASYSKPDLIMLDLRLKDTSGFEGASALRYFLPTSDIPILAMSAFYTVREHDFLANFCGIKKFLKKPFTSSTAIEEIEKLFKMRREPLNRKGAALEDHEKEDIGYR